MSEERPFRYFDEARRLGESLHDIALTPPVAKVAAEGGLDRIAKGNTALSDLQGSQAAASASVPSEMQKAEVKRRLQALLAHKKVKAAARDVVLERFCARAEKLANPMGPDVTPTAMTSGTGGPLDAEAGRGTRYQGVHQGPVGDLIARTLKELREGKA